MNSNGIKLLKKAWVVSADVFSRDPGFAREFQLWDIYVSATRDPARDENTSLAILLWPLSSRLQGPVSAGGAMPEVSGDGALELRVQGQEEVPAQILSHLAAEEGSGEAAGWREVCCSSPPIMYKRLEMFLESCVLSRGKDMSRSIFYFTS